MIINNIEINFNDLYTKKVLNKNVIDKESSRNYFKYDYIIFKEFAIKKTYCQGIKEKEDFKSPYSVYELHLEEFFYDVEIYNKYTDKLLTTIRLKEYNGINKHDFKIDFFNNKKLGDINT